MCKIFKFICNKNPELYVKRKDNVIIIRVTSRTVLKLLIKYLIWSGRKTETIQLKDPVPNYSKKFLIGFLRGLMDTDGHIRKRNVAEFSTVSNNLARNIEQSLKKLKIKYKNRLEIDKRKNRKPISRVVISEDFEKFIKIIKPEHFNYLY